MHEFSVQPPLFPNGATRVTMMKGKGCLLRRMDAAENKYVPGGQYKESWIVLPNWKAAGNQGLYGFNVDEQLTGDNFPDTYGGSVSYQLSNDNGATWYWHNGTAWALVSILTQWNTAAQIDYNIQTFPMTAEKQIRVKARLTPTASGKSTPFLHRVTIFAALDYDFQIDLLRSMKEWLERHVWVRTQYFAQIPQPESGGTGGGDCFANAPTNVLMITDKKWEELSGPAEVYNLTTDPGRTINLFAGFIPGGIQLIADQVGMIEANFMARPPVYIAAEEFMQLASIPSIVVQLVNVKERRDLRFGPPEIDYAKERMKAVLNMPRVWFDAEFRVITQSDLMAEATRMSDAVDKALTHHQFVMSQQTGETMPIPYATPITPSNRIAQGLYVREYSCTLFGKAWLRNDLAVEEDLVESVRFLFNSQMAAKKFDDLEIMEVP